MSELRDELGGIEGQADKLVKINSQMITVVAILDKGIDLACAANKEKVQALSTPREGEDTLTRLERERKKNDFERHVTTLLDSGRSTKKTVADLEKDAVDANTFHDALGKQNVNLRELSSDGIASVATSLNTTIQALNNSALNEASESVRDSMRAMNAVTDDVANKEVIRQALQVDEASKRIMEKVDSMSNIAESLQAANKLREDGLSNIQSRLGELSDVTATVRARLQESIGMDAKDPARRPLPRRRNRSTTRKLRSGRSEPRPPDRRCRSGLSSLQARLRERWKSQMADNFLITGSEKLASRKNFKLVGRAEKFEEFAPS